MWRSSCWPIVGRVCCKCIHVVFVLTCMVAVGRLVRWLAVCHVPVTSVSARPLSHSVLMYVIPHSLSASPLSAARCHHVGAGLDVYIIIIIIIIMAIRFCHMMTTLNNLNHTLHKLLPPQSTASQHYHLRRRTHDRQLPTQTSHLCNKNFVTRALYKDCY